MESKFNQQQAIDPKAFDSVVDPAPDMSMEEGSYKAVISEVEMGYQEGGKLDGSRKVTVSFVIVENNFRIIDQFFLDAESMKWKNDSLFYALGVDTGKQYKQAWSLITGKTLGVDVENKEYNGRVYPRIKKYLRLIKQNAQAQSEQKKAQAKPKAKSKSLFDDNPFDENNWTENTEFSEEDTTDLPFDLE